MLRFRDILLYTDDHYLLDSKAKEVGRITRRPGALKLPMIPPPVYCRMPVALAAVAVLRYLGTRLFSSVLTASGRKRLRYFLFPHPRICCFLSRAKERPTLAIGPQATQGAVMTAAHDACGSLSLGKSCNNHRGTGRFLWPAHLRYPPVAVENAIE